MTQNISGDDLRYRLAKSRQRSRTQMTPIVEVRASRNNICITREMSLILKRSDMAYYFSRKLKIPFDETVQNITRNLQQQGFENIREIDVTQMLKEKYSITFRRYRIMTAFHPDFAYKAISLESHIGLLLPCNIVVQEHENGEVEISATSASETMDKVTATPQLTGIVGDLAHRLRTAIDDLHRVMPEPHHPEALPEEDAEHGRPANLLG